MTASRDGANVPGRSPYNASCPGERTTRSVSTSQSNVAILAAASARFSLSSLSRSRSSARSCSPTFWIVKSRASRPAKRRRCDMTRTSRMRPPLPRWRDTAGLKNLGDTSLVANAARSGMSSGIHTSVILRARNSSRE
jgi:hypothetical protein